MLLLRSAGEERRPPRLLPGSANDWPKGNDHPYTRQHEAIARSHDMSVAGAIREALEQYIVARRGEKDFKKRLEKRLEEDREVLTASARGVLDPL